MSVIIRLQNLPLTASSIDIRNFFHGLSIPDGGVHIVGGPEGDAFIAFSTDEDARQAMRLTGQRLKECQVSLLLSSRNEMYKVIEQARLAAIAGGGSGSSGSPSNQQSSMSTSNSSHLYNTHLGGDSSMTPPTGHHVSSSSGLHGNRHQAAGNNSVSSSMSPTSAASSTNDYLRSLTGVGGGQPDLSSNPALLFGAIPRLSSALNVSQNAFLGHQQNQPFSGMGSPIPATQHQQQNQGFGGTVNTATAPPTSVFPNGNPFLIPPPNMSGMSGMSLPFPGFVQGANGATNTSGSGSNLSGGGAAHSTAMGNPTTTAVMGLASNFMNSTMSLAGHTQNSMNPFGNSAPPRMGLVNNGGGMGHVPGSQVAQGGGPPRHLNNFGMGGMNIHGHGNAFGAGVGANTGGGNRPQQQQHFGQRPPFGNMGNNDPNQNRFQLGSHTSGRMDMTNNRDRDNRDNKQDRSPSKDARSGPLGGNDSMMNRRRRSRSRDRERAGERRRRRSKSLSRSRSRSRDRTTGAKPSRRDSRDKRGPEGRTRGDSSPEKNSQDSSGSRSRRTEHEPSPTPNSMNTTTDEWPGAKLIGIPSDASYREIKEFIRVEVMGGSDGVVRLYDEGTAFLKLQNPSEFPKVFRSNGRKLRGSVVTIEGIMMETWTQEYKLNKSRLERDIDREREEREKEREQNRRGSERDKDHGHGRDRDSRRSQDSHSSSSGHHHRSSRFSNASHQSSCIAIRGLAPTVTKQELVTRYLRDTPCQDVALIAAPTPTNRHSVTAFVQFESAQIAQTVIDGIVRSPLGTQLIVESCDVDDLQKAKERTSGSGSGSVKTGSGMNSPGMMGGDAKSIFELDLGLDDETTTIIMKGAPPSISERDVFDFFSDIGLAPMNVRILYDTDGQCSGQVICEFPDNNKAKRATTKDGMLFGRGHISVSLLPSRNRKLPSADFGSGSSGGAGQTQLQQNFLNRNANPRPGLLGPAPPRGGGAASGGSMPRFPNPTSSPNIFEQALQQQVTGPGPMTRPPSMGRSNNPRGRGERMSRFSNNDSRGDFRNQNGVGRGRGGNVNPNGTNRDDLIITDDDMALFNKKGDDHEEKRQTNSCVIGLENIPYKASMDDILQYLEEILKIRISPDRIIRRYDDKQKPTGDARVAFDTAFEAKLACDRLRGTYMWKRLITGAVIE